jgi:hypothetical protein
MAMIGMINPESRPLDLNMIGLQLNFFLLEAESPSWMGGMVESSVILIGEMAERVHYVITGV